MSSTTECQMKPEYKALGLYYFEGRSIEEAAMEAGLRSEVVEGLVKRINEHSIKALQEFYSDGGNLGYVAAKYGLNRNELLGFMCKNELNLNYEHERSRKKIRDLEKIQTPPL